MRIEKKSLLDGPMIALLPDQDTRGIEKRFFSKGRHMQRNI